MRQQIVTKKKSAGMILLEIFLVLTALRLLFNLFLNSNYTDMRLLDYYGLSVLGYLIFVVLLVLNILSIYGIFARKKFGYLALISFFVLSIFMMIFATILGVNNISLLQQLAVESRTTRELSTEGVGFVNSPILIITTFIFY